MVKEEMAEDLLEATINQKMADFIDLISSSPPPFKQELGALEVIHHPEKADKYVRYKVKDSPFLKRSRRMEEERTKRRRLDGDSSARVKRDATDEVSRIGKDLYERALDMMGRSGSAARLSKLEEGRVDLVLGDVTSPKEKDGQRGGGGGRRDVMTSKMVEEKEVTMLPSEMDVSSSQQKLNKLLINKDQTISVLEQRLKVQKEEKKKREELKEEGKVKISCFNQ